MEAEEHIAGGQLRERPRIDTKYVLGENGETQGLLEHVFNNHHHLHGDHCLCGHCPVMRTFPAVSFVNLLYTPWQCPP